MHGMVPPDPPVHAQCRLATQRRPERLLRFPRRAGHVIVRYCDGRLLLRPDLLARLGELRGRALGCGCSRAVAGRRAHRRAEASRDVASPARPPNPTAEVRVAVLPETAVLDMGTFRHDGPSRRLGCLDTRVASSRVAAQLARWTGPAAAAATTASGRRVRAQSCGPTCMPRRWSPGRSRSGSHDGR